MNSPNPEAPADPAAPPSPSGSSSSSSNDPPEAAPPGANGATYFPPPSSAAGAQWETISASGAGFDQAKLDAFTKFVGDSKSTTLIVLYQGRILVEKYWGGATATTLRDVASVQKSVSSMLAGIAMDRGAFGLDDKVTSILGVGWSNGATPLQEAAVTVRHILTMTSGLNADLQYDTPAGTKWLYNTDGYHRINRILEKKSGEPSVEAFTRKVLFDPIGVGNSAWATRPFQKDAKGVPIISLEMNARDMARVGLLVMNNGVWGATGGASVAVVPSTYLTTALTPSQTLNPSYGFLFWLNGQSSALLPPNEPRDGTLIPSAPTDLVAGLGAADQKIYVSRSKSLVVIRQGQSAGALGAALSTFDNDLWQHLMAAKL